MRAPGMCPCGQQFVHYGTFATAVLARKEARRRMIKVLNENSLPVRFTAIFAEDGTGFFNAPNGMHNGCGGDYPIRVKMVVTRKMAVAGAAAAGAEGEEAPGEEELGGISSEESWGEEAGEEAGEEVGEEAGEEAADD